MVGGRREPACSAAWNRTTRTRRHRSPARRLRPVRAPDRAVVRRGRPGRRSSARDPGGGAAEGPRRLYRSRDDRVIGGVCGGLAEYFGIDPLIVRIITVAPRLRRRRGPPRLPRRRGSSCPTRTAPGRGRRTAAWRPSPAPSLLVLAIGTVLPFRHGPFGGWGWGGPLVSLICLGLAGLGRLVGGVRRASRRVGHARHPAARRLRRRAPRGLRPPRPRRRLGDGRRRRRHRRGASSSSRASARRGRLPRRRALADPPGARAGPAGRRRLGRGRRRRRRRRRPRVPPGGRPTEIREHYELGVGQLVVDLRDADLPPGDRRIHVEVGAGEARSARAARRVRDERRRTSAPAQVDVFDHDSGGLDVDWHDRPQAPAGTPAADRRRRRRRRRPRRRLRRVADEHCDGRRGFADRERGNAGCIGGAWLGATWTSRRSSRASPSSCSASSLLLDRLDGVRPAASRPWARWPAPRSGPILLASGLGRRD